MSETTTGPIVTPPGLAGVVVADTAIGDVRGDEGFFHYRQYDATALARERSFEEVWHLLVRGVLPNPEQLRAWSELEARIRGPRDRSWGTSATTSGW